MRINFYPDSDRKRVLVATEVYRDLWDKRGDQIIREFKKLTGLDFKEEYVNAVVYSARLHCRSFPLSLRADLSKERKLGVLIHELVHRLLVGNRIGLMDDYQSRQERLYEIHRVVFLVLYDIWVAVEGEEFAQAMVEKEKKSRFKAYRRAWEWALSLDKEEREERFKRLVKQAEDRKGKNV